MYKNPFVKIDGKWHFKVTAKEMFDQFLEYSPVKMAREAAEKDEQVKVIKSIPLTELNHLQTMRLMHRHADLQEF